MTLASWGGGGVLSSHFNCDPPASFSVHLASSAVTPAWSVHKSKGDNVAAVEEMMYVYVSVTKGTSHIVVMDVI